MGDQRVFAGDVLPVELLDWKEEACTIDSQY